VLILTILSAQTTDLTVDKVRKPLFIRFPTPEALANAPVDEVETIIRITGFYHTKARHIVGTAQKIVRDFGGEVPRTMDELLTLPGVGRKTANIVLFHALGKNHGIAVDTHVKRLAQRIGLSANPDQDKIEQDLMNLYPAETWGDLTDLLITHGRRVCTARKPKCHECFLARHCRYYRTQVAR
jgi:endonuclease-3